MPSIRILLNPMRTAKQGVNVNIGKDGDEYKQIVTTLSLHESDLESLGADSGDRVLVKTDHGEAEFTVKKDKVPEGMGFVPYGPPTCKLMPSDTDGTGMPTSKGWEADVQPL